MRFINLLTGRRWWYEVELHYRSKQGQQLACMRTQIGLAKRSHILNARDIKKEFAPELINGVFKNRLCNGTVSLRVHAYLWLPQTTNHKAKTASGNRRSFFRVPRYAAIEITKLKEALHVLAMPSMQRSIHSRPDALSAMYKKVYGGTPINFTLSALW
jgi:hypothetical protein